MNSEEVNGRQALALRIRACAAEVGGGSELARKAGISRRTLENYLSSEREPKASSLALIAKAASVSVHWLVTGEGPMRISDQMQDRGVHGQTRVATGAPGTPIPPEQIAASELFALVIDAVHRAFKDSGGNPSTLDLGRISVEKYNEIAREAPDPEDWRGAVKMMAAQLRKDIASTAADPANRKREVS